MNKQLLIKQSLIFIVLSFILWIGYLVAMHYTSELTHQILLANPSTKGWTRWVYEFYPRLQIEKWRFSETFFLSKAEQILSRMAWTIQFMLMLYSFKIIVSQKIVGTYQRLTNLSIGRKFVPYLTLLLYTCLLLVVYNAILEFSALAYFSPFYQPVGIGKLLLPIFPSINVLRAIYILLLGSIGAVLLLPKKWISATVAALAFVYYQLILFGFGKYDHGFSTLTYALLIYPFFLWEVERSKQSTVTAWSIILIQWMICLTYFYCALEKIATSGINWFASDNLQQHLLIHETPLGLQLASYAGLCKLLSFAVLLFQFSFIALPFQKKLTYILLPAGFIFHSATWILLDAGGLFNPWWGVYFFFLFPLQPQETE